METNILIADDEPNQLELMDYNLRNAGFSIIKAQMVKRLLS
jgi:DNA-binding NtrC family response regulator